MQLKTNILGAFIKLTLVSMLLFWLPTEAAAQFPWSGKKLSADDYLQMVTQKIREKQYKRAIQMSYEGLDNRPDYMDLHFMQGRAFMLNNQFDSARIKFKYVMTEDPRYRDAYLLGTNLEMQLNNKEEANCIINDGLYYFPFERDFMIKKLEVLDFNRDLRGADKYAEKIMSIHFNDSIAVAYYISYKLERARYYTKLGNYYKASECYADVLDEQPWNKEAIDGKLNLEIKQGKVSGIIEQLNAELGKNPKSYEALTKKVILLSDQYHYSEALEVAEQLVKYFPGDSRARILHYETQMACGRFFMKEDPYLVFQGVLEKRPTDKEALNYTINLATARGLYLDALAFENKALLTTPNDAEILQKKIGTLEYLERYAEAANIANRMLRTSPNNADYRKQAIELNMLSGRQFMKEKEFDSAATDLNTVLRLDPRNTEATLFLAETYMAQKKYDESLATLDKALDDNPNNQVLQFKRAVVLQDAGLLDLAAAQAVELHKEHPSDLRYKNLVVDIKTSYAKNLMAIDDYDGAREEYRAIIKLQPQNTDALNGLINLESGSHRYDSALFYANNALAYYPENRDFLLKKSSVLEAQKQYREAYAITGDLMQRYPYNSKIKQAYVEQLLASGGDYNKRMQYDSALTEFYKVLEINPRDSNALHYATNILIEKNLDDSALALNDKALHYYPNNEQFTFKRATILEKKKDYVAASAAADSLVLINPSLRNIDFADALKAHALRNQLGFMFLYSTFDSASNITRANIATIQYARYTKWGSLTGRLNMAGRSMGTGMQLEMDINYKHNPKWFSFASAGVSNEIVFPSIKFAYSLNYNYKKVYIFEGGFRFLRFNNTDINMLSGVASITRDWKDFWANLRYFAISQGPNLYHAANLQCRLYLTPTTEYVTTGVGIGNSPDEFSRNYLLTENVKIRTYSFNMGYTKVFRYRNTFSVTGTWYNQELSSGYFRNQYDVFFMFLRKF